MGKISKQLEEAKVSQEKQTKELKQAQESNSKLINDNVVIKTLFNENNDLLDEVFLHI